MFVKPCAIPQDDIPAAAAILRAGGTVAFPTETVYGLGADASNPLAVRQIFEIKGRPDYHPLIVHIADVSQLHLWAENIPDAAWRLAEQFWPGPLTLILPRRGNVLDEITGGQDTVGLRVPAHPVALALLRAFGGGIAAPSANRFGRVSPTTAQHVRDELGSRVDVILDGGPCYVGVESTIVGLTTGKAVLLRPGGLSIEAIEHVLKQKILRTSPAAHTERVSGLLDSHYAPATPIEILPVGALSQRALQLAGQGLKVAMLFQESGAMNHSNSISKVKQGGDERTTKAVHSVRLGVSEEANTVSPMKWNWNQESGEGITHIPMPGSASEYGRIFYATLHRLDHGGFDRLLIEAPSATDEWLAINDRMQRAAHGSVKEDIFSNIFLEGAHQ